MFASLAIPLLMLAAPSPAAKQAGAPTVMAASKVRSLSVESPAGEVKIRAKRGNAITLSQRKTLGAEGCAARLTLFGAEAKVVVSDPESKPCSVDIELLVPPQMAVTVQQQDGSLLLSGTRGALRLRLAHGNAVVGGTFPALDAQVDTGSLSVQGLAGDGVIHAATGNVQVYFAPKARGTLTLDVGQGNATVFADRPVSVGATTSSPQQVSNGLPASPGSEAGVRIEGDVRVGRLTIKRSG